jgi:sigma-E factor negative regulatory protein RseA
MEKISALMDGELDRQNAQTTIALLKQDESLQSEWATYHLIGDALRDHWLTPIDVSQKLKAKLSQEPAIVAPHPLPMEKFKMATMPVAASVAAIALVGWLAFANTLPKQEITIATSAIPTLASTPPPIVPKAAKKTNVRPSKQLNEYLLAHQEYSPTMALQGVTPYVQTVAMSETDR